MTSPTPSQRRLERLAHRLKLKGRIIFVPNSPDDRYFLSDGNGKLFRLGPRAHNARRALKELAP